MATDIRTGRAKNIVCYLQRKEFAIDHHFMIVLFEFRGYHNQAIYYTNWLRQKPDNAKLVRALLTTAKLRKSLEGF